MARHPLDTAEQGRFILDEGEHRRALGLPAVDEPPETWLERARKHAVWIIQMKGSVTSDDIIAQIGMPPANVHSNVIGTIFKVEGYRKVGETKSERPSARGRKIAIWTLKAVPSAATIEGSVG